MFRQGFIRYIYAYFTADNDNADFRANGLSATSLWGMLQIFIGNIQWPLTCRAMFQSMIFMVIMGLEISSIYHLTSTFIRLHLWIRTMGSVHTLSASEPDCSSIWLPSDYRSVYIECLLEQYPDFAQRYPHQIYTTVQHKERICHTARILDMYRIPNTLESHMGLTLWSLCKQ